MVEHNGDCETPDSEVVTTTTFDIENTIRDGVTMTLSGTTESTQSLDESAPVSLAVELRRDFTHEDRGANASFEVSGTLVAVADEAARTVTLNGALKVHSQGTRRGDMDREMVFTDVVRAHPGDCRWPVSGVVERRFADDDAVIIEFGPECGDASRDGEPVDLREATTRNHGKRRSHFHGHRHRGFGGSLH